ncbi:MAG: DUF1573 domain-containing protein [Bacteroidia bacterium]
MKIKYLTLALALSLVTVACDQKSGENNDNNAEISNTEKAIDPEIIKESNPHTAEGDAEIAEVAEITWEKTNHNFGKVNYQQKVLYDFEFENTGDKDLIILDAKASCGCTTPEWPKEPIPPGGTGVVTVGFKSTSKGPFNKSITVDANTVPKSTVLYIKGEVLRNDT